MCSEGGELGASRALQRHSCQRFPRLQRPTADMHDTTTSRMSDSWERANDHHP
ncbi:hypothetical protein F751_0956 [Auxenochlorella protothecoides]|uniref:Uncharacterized protein n=1 Tax=Auxenochlorella protothecoides TaxID=3075 RepID=A0A087SDD8_AUXPR|nr:hypothetical protein F751_0956 [Auxenochlorella protothecoides]KFM23742.1 hypothetical protein F751_0956 [Auxenochlorella protothecoides]